MQCIEEQNTMVLLIVYMKYLSDSILTSLAKIQMHAISL